MQRELYPADWDKIAFAVKEDAGWKCQKCGKQCRRPGEAFDTHKRTLTVAHLNHTPEDVRPENLMAMCAPCHLRYDAKQHAETRRRKRNDKSRSG
jgi:5-methylcytosine-specific restriction endonuclease McrA